MQRSQFSDLSVFVEVARQNGFRAAARALQLTPGSVSEAIQRFEDRLGVRLFERSTRSIALTAAGERLFERSLAAVDELERAIADIDERPDVVSGTLRLTAPRGAGAFFLDALVVQYTTDHPDVSVQVLYDDQKVDLISSGVDAAIRSTTLLDPDTHAVSIGPEMPMVIVASPSYLKRRGRVKHPDELVRHDGICFVYGDEGNLAPWKFTSDADDYTVMPNPKIIVNDLTSMLNYCEAGIGLAYTFASTTKTLIKEKRLVSVLKPFVAPLPRFSINYLSKRHMPARLRAFIDIAKR